MKRFRILLPVLLPALMLLAALTSCSRAKDYTIHGLLTTTDTLASDPRIAEMIEGQSVYLLDLHGDLIDSAVVAGGEFTIRGTVEEPRFAYIASSFAANMIVIEGGDILLDYSNLYFDNSASGTPSNDGIGRLEDALYELQEEASRRIEALRCALPDSTFAVGDTVAQQAAMRIYFDISDRVSACLDSTIDAHPEDLVGVYAVHMRTADATTPEELEEALEDYSAFIRENELFVVRLEYLHELRNAPTSFGHDMFDPTELGLETGEDE